jgi:hypothetical protein
MISKVWTGLVVLTLSIPARALIASPAQAFKPEKLTFKELKHIIAL